MRGHICKKQKTDFTPNVLNEGLLMKGLPTAVWEE